VLSDWSAQAILDGVHALTADLRAGVFEPTILRSLAIEYGQRASAVGLARGLELCGYPPGTSPGCAPQPA
jgi:hypothetical protein